MLKWSLRVWTGSVQKRGRLGSPWCCCLPLVGLVWQAVWGHSQQMWKADEPFVSSEDNSPATGSESDFYLPIIPAAKFCTPTSQKAAIVPSTWCYKSRNDFWTPGFCRFQYCSGFSNFFLYNRKLLESYEMTVTVTNQVHIICTIFYMLWYTTPVLTNGRTNSARWCSQLWH